METKSCLVRNIDCRVPFFRRFRRLPAVALLAGTCACGGLVEDPVESKRTDELDYYNGCVGLSATNGWVNTGFGEQVNQFGIEFDLIPSSASMDAVFGLSQGWADAATDLAAGVRLTRAGLLEARSGSAYTALNPLRYTSGQIHRTRLDVDLLAKRYSVAITPPRATTPVQIARDFPFASEQATLGRLDTLAQTVASSSGAFSLCRLRVFPHSDCLPARAAEGWVVTRFDAQMGLFTISFDATPSAAPIDAPVGLQAGDAMGWTEVAAAVRFSPSGIIDVRDGGQYRADVPMPYEANQVYRFEMRVDVMTRRYSVWVHVGPSTGAYKLLASDYAFRTEQSSVTSLARLARVVASPTGSVDVCNVSTHTPTGQLQYLKHLVAQDAAATPTGNLVVSSVNRSVLLDPNGAVLAEAPFGGRVAVDERGYITLAGTFSGQTRVGGPTLTSAGGTDIYVAQFGPNWQHRWSRRFGTPADDSLGDVDAGKGVVVTSDTAGTLRLNTDGTLRWQSSVGGADVAMDVLGNVFIVKNFSRSITVGEVTHDVGEDTAILLAGFDNAGVPSMSRAFSAEPAPDDELGYEHEFVKHVAATGWGQILISGTFLGRLNFGGVQLIRSGSSTGHFVARLSTDGVGIAAEPVPYEVSDIAGDRFGNFAVTGYDNWTSVMHLDVYDSQWTPRLSATSPLLPHADARYVSTGQGVPHAIAFDGLDHRRAVYWVGSASYTIPSQNTWHLLPFVVKYAL